MSFTFEVQFGGERSEEPCPDLCRLREGGKRRLQGGDALAVDEPEPAEHRPLVGQRGSRRTVSVTVFEGQAPSLQQRLPVGRIPGAALGLAENDEYFADLGVVADLSGGAQGPFQMVDRLLVSEGSHRSPTGVFGVAGGLGYIFGPDCDHRGGR